MFWSGLIDYVPMSIEEDGLHTEGWLWKVARFVDLSDLRTDIAAIDQSTSKIQKQDWINYEFQEYENEDIQLKLRQFFWVLLRNLSQAKRRKVLM
jgi:hypothetical protein